LIITISLIITIDENFFFDTGQYQIIRKTINFVEHSYVQINIKEYLKILELFASNKSNSTSQCFQDLFVLYFSKFKSDGYFVDIGASNGVTLVILYFREERLERNCSEPENTWHKKLNQRNCIKDYRAIYDQSDLDVLLSH
jgi:hypothetical protein